MNKAILYMIIKQITLACILLLSTNTSYTMKKFAGELKSKTKTLTSTTGKQIKVRAQKPSDITFTPTSSGTATSSVSLAGKPLFSQLVSQEGLFPSSYAEQAYEAHEIPFTSIRYLLENMNDKTPTHPIIPEEVWEGAIKEAKNEGLELIIITNEANEAIENIGQQLNVQDYARIPGGFLAKVPQSGTAQTNLSIKIYTTPKQNPSNLAILLRSPVPLTPVKTKAKKTLQAAEIAAKEKAAQEIAEKKEKENAAALEEEKNNAEMEALLLELEPEIEKTIIEATTEHVEKEISAKTTQQKQEHIRKLADITTHYEQLTLEMLKEEKEEQEKIDAQLQKIEQAKNETELKIKKIKQDLDTLILEQEISEKEALENESLEKFEALKQSHKDQQQKALDDIKQAETEQANLEKEEQNIIEQQNIKTAKLQQQIESIKEANKIAQQELTTAEQSLREQEVEINKKLDEIQQEKEKTKLKINQEKEQALAEIDAQLQQAQEKADQAAKKLQEAQQNKTLTQQEIESLKQEEQKILQEFETNKQSIEAQKQETLKEIAQKADQEIAKWEKEEQDILAQQNIKTAKSKKQLESITTEKRSLEQEIIIENQAEMEANKKLNEIQQAKNEINRTTKEQIQQAHDEIDAQLQQAQQNADQAVKNLQKAQQNKTLTQQEIENLKQEDQKALQEFETLKQSLEAQKQNTLKEIKQNEVQEISKLDNELIEQQKKVEEIKKKREIAEQKLEQTKKDLEEIRKRELTEQRAKEMPKVTIPQGGGELGDEKKESKKPKPTTPEHIKPTTTPKKAIPPLKEIKTPDITSEIAESVQITVPQETVPEVISKPMPQAKAQPPSSPYRKSLFSPEPSTFGSGRSTVQPPSYFQQPWGQELGSRFIEKGRTSAQGQRPFRLSPSLFTPTWQPSRPPSTGEYTPPGEQRAGNLTSTYQGPEFLIPEAKESVLPKKEIKAPTNVAMVKKEKGIKEEKLPKLKVPQRDLPRKKKAEKPKLVEEVNWFWRMINAITEYIRQLISS